MPRESKSKRKQPEPATPTQPEVAYSVRVVTPTRWQLVQLERTGDGMYIEAKVLYEDLPMIIAGQVKNTIAMELIR